MPSIRVGRFGLELPNGYQLHTLTLLAPTTNAAGETLLKNVILVQEPLLPGEKVADFRKRYVEQVRRVSPSFTVVKASTVKIAGEDCTVFDVHNLGPGGRPVANLIAFKPLGTTVLVLCAVHERGGAFDESRAEFLQVFQGLTVAAP